MFVTKVVFFSITDVEGVKTFPFYMDENTNCYCSFFHSVSKHKHQMQATPCFRHWRYF